MARLKITGPRTASAATEELDSYSIAEFCKRNSISVAMFYKLRGMGQAPATFCVGVRQLISKEAAAAWRRAREAAARKAVIQ